MSSSRRDLLKYLPLWASSWGILKAAQSPPNVPAIRFPSRPRDRIAVTSWPFRSLFDLPGNRYRDTAQAAIDMKDFPSMIAKRFDVHKINPLTSHFRSLDKPYLDAFREAVQKAGSQVVDLGLGGGSFYDPSDSKRREAVDRGCKGIDVAVVVGSPSVRQHVSGQRGSKPDVALAAGSLGQLADYGAKRGIVVNLENDDAVSEDPYFLVSIIEKANNPYLRGLPDFGNSLRKYDAARNEKAVAEMFKHVFNMCHVKDSVRSAQDDILPVDLKAMFEIAKASSYRGYFSMEFDTKGGVDPFVGTEKLITETLQYLA